MVQTAEGNLDEVHSILQRVRELAVQYKNGSLGQSGKDAIQSEINQLASEVDRIGASAQFNGISLLDGTAGGSGSVTFQVGANDSDTLSISFPSLSTKLGSAWVDMSTASLSDIDAAIDAVTDVRSGFGATQNRLDHALSVTAVYQENLTSAESRIRDVDMADEMVELTKNQILQQAGTAMLAQANQAPQAVLSLLRQ
jgi:flagellin